MAKKDKRNKSRMTTTAPAKPVKAARPAPRSEDKSSAAPRGTVSTKPAGRVRTFFREVRIEMKKVTWPPRNELIKSTGVVIVAVAIAAVFIFAFDRLWIFLVDITNMGG
jgi:preprotein translocase subunit SecE